MIEKYKFKVKLLCKLSYIGKNYHGFQYMTEQLPTIQGQFGKVLDKLCLTNYRLQTSSRTDKDVNAFGHPLGICLYRDGLTLAKLDKLQIAMNHHQYKNQEDISVSDLYVVPHDSYSKDVENKVYRYNIISNLGYSHKSSIYRYERVWPQKEYLDKQKFERVLKIYEGTHEFHNFTKFDKFNKLRPTVSSIDNVDLELIEDNRTGFQDYKILFSARRFSRYQIRFMMGFAYRTMIDSYSEDDLKDFQTNKKDLGTFRKGRELAPGKGLFLNNVNYNSEITKKWLTVQQFREIAEQYYEFENTDSSVSSNINEKQKEIFKDFYDTYLSNEFLDKDWS